MRPYCSDCYPNEEVLDDEDDQNQITPNQYTECVNCRSRIWTGSFEVPTEECPKCGVLFGNAPSGTYGIGGESDFGPNEDYY